MSRVLCQTQNPEEKRKIIGDTFMKVIQTEASKAGLENFENYFLAQGLLMELVIFLNRKLAYHYSITDLKFSH